MFASVFVCVIHGNACECLGKLCAGKLVNMIDIFCAAQLKNTVCNKTQMNFICPIKDSELLIIHINIFICAKATFTRNIVTSLSLVIYKGARMNCL